jgi:hypothetical protein
MRLYDLSPKLQHSGESKLQGQQHCSAAAGAAVLSLCHDQQVKHYQEKEYAPIHTMVLGGRGTQPTQRWSLAAAAGHPTHPQPAAAVPAGA